MHLLLLLALTHVPGATCHVPCAASHVQRATADVQLVAWHPAPGTRHVEETVQSAALGRSMKYRVLLPEDYDTSQRRFPVLYLLHGLGGDYTDWTTRTNLAEYSRALPLIIVMPDGGNSWYTNSAGNPADRYEDYLLGDLQADVVKKFRTVNSRHGRAIAGLSMGGYGALKVAMKRPAAFAVAGSFSGAVNITRPGEFDRILNKVEAERIQTIFGPPDSATRTGNDVLALAAALKAPGAPYLYLDCGTSDSALVGANRDIAAALHKTGAAYEYHEVPGAHAWDYWDRRIREFLPLLMKRLSNP